MQLRELRPNSVQHWNAKQTPLGFSRENSSQDGLKIDESSIEIKKPFGVGVVNKSIDSSNFQRYTDRIKHYRKLGLKLEK